MDKYIWIVSEDNHGDVSYFDSKEKAIEEMLKIIEDVYEEPVPFDEIEEDEIEIRIPSIDYVSIRREKLNESWAISYY